MQIIYLRIKKKNNTPRNPKFLSFIYTYGTSTTSIQITDVKKVLELISSYMFHTTLGQLLTLALDENRSDKDASVTMTMKNYDNSCSKIF